MHTGRAHQQAALLTVVPVCFCSWSSCLQAADVEAQARQIAAVHAAQQAPAGGSEAEDEEELPKFANNPAREFQLLLGRVRG